MEPKSTNRCSTQKYILIVTVSWLWLMLVLASHGQWVIRPRLSVGSSILISNMLPKTKANVLTCSARHHLNVCAPRARQKLLLQVSLPVAIKTLFPGNSEHTEK